MNKESLAARYHLHEPVTRTAIAEREQQAGFAFPADYVALLLLSNGLQTDGNLSLLDVDSIGERNRDYEVQTYLPGFVMIGDDSGGTAIIMRSGEPAIYEVGMGVMDAASMEKSADSLEDLLVRYQGRTLSER